MKNSYGEKLKKTLISGYNNLYNYYPEINKLNVFPVPDGDTGTNMNLTMYNAIKEINNIKSNSISKIADIFAHGLIMGARGNSGVILSQIFRGFADSLKGIKILNTEILKKSFLLSKEIAYKSVIKPVEGTILTIIREISENLLKIDNNLSILETLTKVVYFAKNSLNNTPKLLPILKEAGVVDSGGFGFVKILEGFLIYIKTGKVVEKNKKKLIKINNINKNIENINNKKQIEKEKFGYCTEFIILLNNDYLNKKKLLNKEEISKKLENDNNKSIIIIIDKNILKIHIHSLKPGDILNYFQNFGEFKNIKIDNMMLQNKKYIKNNKINYIKKFENKEAIIAVTPSKGISDFFIEKLMIKNIIENIENMNPSTNEYIEAIKKANAEYIYILPNNENSILSAQQAAKIEKKSKVFIIPSKTIQEGMMAALYFDNSKNIKKKIHTLKNSLKKVTSLFISIAAKNTLLNKIKINKNDYIGIVNKKIIISNPEINKVIKNIFNKSIKKTSEIITIFYGKYAKKNDIDMIKKYLNKKYFDIEYEIINGGQSLYTYIIAIE